MAHYYVDSNGNITQKKKKQNKYSVDLDGNITVVSEEEEEEDIAPLPPSANNTTSTDKSTLSDPTKEKDDINKRIAEIEEELGYNDPLLVQFANAFSGDSAKNWAKGLIDEILVGEGGGYRTHLKNELEELKAKRDSGTKDEDGSWLKGGLFSDGYQVGDAAGTVVGTAVHGVGEFAKGIGSGFEGITDLILHGAGEVSELVGADKLGQFLKNSADYDSINMLVDTVTGEGFEHASVIGKQGEALPQALGYIKSLGWVGKAGEILALGKKGIDALVTAFSFLSSTGSSVSEARNHEKQYATYVKDTIKELDKMLGDGEITKEAYNQYKTELEASLESNSVSDREAWAYGFLNGAINAGSEMLFGGLGKQVNALGVSRGISSLDDQFAKLVTKKLSNHVVRNIAQGTIKAGGEAFEEVLAAYGSAWAKHMTYMSDEDLKKLVEDENVLEQAIVGFFASGISQAGGISSSIKNKTDYITGLNSNEQAVIDKEVEKRVAEKEKKDGKKASNKAKNEIYERVLGDMDKGYISIDTIEEVLGGDSLKAYKDTVSKEDALKAEKKAMDEEFKVLNGMKPLEMTGEQTDRREELRAKRKELGLKIAEMDKTTERDFLQSKYKNEVREVVRGSRLEESYNEQTRRGQAFAADLSKYDEKQRAIVQKAIDSGVLNNTNRAHEFVDIVAKLAADKGVTFDFLNNEKLKETGFAKDDVFVNGYYDSKSKTIGINMDSAKAWQSTVGHEITHVLEGTDLYDGLKDVLFKYAESKGEYNSRREALSKLYAEEDLDSELVADLVGDYLFQDADFVKHLSTTDRNVFQKIYDEIKYLAKVVTAGTKEARDIEKIKHTFEEVYRTQSDVRTSDADVQYSQGDGKKPLDKYSQKQYNDFGWARDSGGITKNELDDLYSKVQTKRSLKQFPQSGYGESIVEVNNDPNATLGTNNVFAFVKGTKNNPQITKVVRFQAETDTEMEIIKESLYERGTFSYSYYSYLKEEGLAREYSKKSAIDYNEYAQKTRSGIGRGDSNEADGHRGIEQDGRGTFEQAQSDDIAPIKEASSTDGVFFDGKNVKHSLSDTNQEADTYSRIYDMQVEVNQLTQSIQAFEKTPEFKTAMDALGEAINSGDIDNGVKAYQKWRVDSGYDDMVSRRDSLRVELENLRKDFNDSIANKAIAEEQASIAKSGLSEAEYFRKQAVKEFGYTPFFYDAGYITPNGKMLNFSGEKGKHYGTRGQDHRAIGTIYAETEGTDALNRFVKDGNIRIMAESPGIDVSTIAEPTKEQYATIRKFVSEYAGKEYFNVDFTDESGKVIGSLTYENRINPTRIVNDIKHFYETGEIRQPSNLSQFLSLSEEGEAPVKYGNFATPARDLLLETAQEDVAPVAQAADVPVTETAQDMFPDDYAPMSEDEGASEERIASLDESVMPPETEPYYGEEDAPIPSDPFEARDIKEVGNRKVKAYMYENPEVKPFFQEEANIMLGELRDTVKGEKLYSEEGGWTGTSRHTSDDVAYLRDSLGMSYAEIEKGLNAIIEDNGKENIASAKRIEFLLNDRLAYGYTDFRDGAEIPANQDYINLINEKGISEYASEARQQYFEASDELAPPEDIGPVVETTAAADIGPIKEEYEAIKPKKKTSTKRTANKLVRADNVTPEQQKIAEVLDAEPETTTRKSRAWAKFKANVLDKGAVFEDLALKTKNRELMGKWNYILYSESRAQSLMGNGAEGVKPLNSIIEEVGKTGKTKQFYEYLYHQHNVDRMSLVDKADAEIAPYIRTFWGYTTNEIADLSRKRITQNTSEEDADLIRQAKEYVRLREVKNKPVFGDSVTAEASREAVAQLEKANPEFKRFAQDVYDYNNHLRNLLVESGVISQETADVWAETYPHYVPIRRAGKNGLNVNVPLDTGRTGVNAPVKQATGGNSDILPLFDTMAMRTMQTYKAIAKNSFGVELKNSLGTTIESEPTGFDDVIDSIEQQDGLLKKGENGGNPTFTVFENGEKVTYEITEDMYDALKPTSEGLSLTNKVLNTASNIHRGVLTEYNPVFMLTNAVKDVQDVLINSQHPIKTYAKIPEAYAQMFQKGYWYKEYIANGGEQNTYFDNETNTFDKDNKGLKKLLDIPPLSTISKLNNFIEMTPRLAEYIASREAGRSVEVSMLDAARVTTNFSAGGDLTKFLNRNGATFLNASVQGAMQQVRNVREAKANGAKGWVNLATKFALAGLPALLLNGLLWEDDEEYEELSDYVKQNYYIVGKYGDGKFIRIPKGRTLAVIQNAFEQVSNAATGNDEADLKSFLELAVSNLAPNNPIENNILAPIIQVANNKTWYGEDLVPTRLQDLPAAEQFDESTDSISKWLGEKLDVSPYKINYLLDQYTGGIGDTFLPMLTPEAESGDNSMMGNLLAPLKSKFTTDGVINNQNVSDFYDKKDELTTNAKASAATTEDVLMNKYMNSVNSELSDLYAMKREIQNSNLPDGEKYAQVREIQKQIVDLTKSALNTYEQVDINGEYATVGDTYFKLNKNGEWVKLDEDEETKYKVTSAAGDSPYATDGSNHYRWYVKEGETDGEWRKITEEQLEKQNKVTSGLGISASDYWGNKEEYDYAYEYPGNYAVARAVGGYESFKTYSSELYDIKADKDANGKTISGSRKNKVADYINGLDIGYGEKIILFKSEYPSDDSYNEDIIEYLDSREDLSYEDMVTILTELGFKVNGNTVTWD